MHSTHQTVVYRLGEVGIQHVGERLDRSSPCNGLVGCQVRVVGREVYDFSRVIDLNDWILLQVITFGAYVDHIGGIFGIGNGMLDNPLEDDCEVCRFLASLD